SSSMTPPLPKTHSVDAKSPDGKSPFQAPSTKNFSRTSTQGPCRTRTVLSTRSTAASHASFGRRRLPKYSRFIAGRQRAINLRQRGRSRPLCPSIAGGGFDARHASADARVRHLERLSVVLISDVHRAQNCPYQVRLARMRGPLQIPDCPFDVGGIPQQRL